MPDYLSSDLDGNPRLSNGARHSYATIDFGAYERPGTSTPAATVVLAQPSTYSPFSCCNTTAYAILATLSSPFGIPTGSVTFYDNGAFLGTGVIDASGKASFVPRTVSKGLHSYVVTYDGQGVFPPGISVRFYMRFDADFTNGLQTQLALNASPNPAALANPVTLKASLSAPSGIPSGAITFSDGAANLGSTPLSNGVATLTVSNLSRGTHTITASYPGDRSYAPSTETTSERIVGAASSTTLAASASNVPANTPITLTASTTTSGTAPDLTKLQILDGTTPLTPLSINASGVATTLTLLPGIHVLTASYVGDAANEPSTSAPVTVIVQGSPTTTVLSADPSQPTAFHGFYAVFTTTAAVGAPRGTIALTVDGQRSAYGSVDGLPVLTSKILLSLPAGPHTLVETYTPADGTTLPSSATLLLNVARAPVTLTLGATPAPFVQSQTATVTALLDDGTARRLATGSVTPLIDGNPQAALTPSSTGQIALVLQGLAVGTHTVAFSYAGDSNFLPATSASATITVLQRGFALKHDTSLSVPAGSYIERTLNLASIGGFADAVTLTCDNLPASASCRFSRNPMPVTAGGNVPVQFALDTSALPGYQQSARLRSDGGHTGPLLAGLMGPLGALAGLLLLRSRRRHALPVVLLLAVAAFSVAIGLAGCSGQLPAYTAPGTYTIRLTGSAPGITHSQTVSLQVTSPAR